jgi:riboflavin kinase/FMN adenylyltransferase
VSCTVVDYEGSARVEGACVAAIGVFDGVHRGHQALVGDACARARALGVQCVAVTFDRDPDRYLDPDNAAPQLLTLDEKTRYLCEAGADVVLVISFGREVAELTPERFVSEVLLDALEVREVHVGHDFRFGHKAAGTVDTLRELGDADGFTVVDHALVEVAGAPVTSTRIRAAIAEGDVALAAELIGRFARIHGPVVHGRGDGRTLGWPTANVAPQPHAAVPAPGVYAGIARFGSQEWPAAISVGRPPSFPGAEEAVEAHLIGFEGDLNRTELRLDFIERLRSMACFDSREDLVAAIAADVEDAARIVSASAQR